MACESGYALYFYPNKSSKDPYTGSFTSNQLYLMCVDAEDIEYRNYRSCTIHYDNGKIYNVDQLDSDDKRQELCEGNKYLKTKLELFKKYKEVFTTEKQQECAK